MESNCFQKILYVISDKAAFVSGSAALCTALPGKTWALPLKQRLMLADNSFAYICGNIITWIAVKLLGIVIMQFMWKIMWFSNHQAWEHVLVHPQNKIKTL